MNPLLQFLNPDAASQPSQPNQPADFESAMQSVDTNDPNKPSNPLLGLLQNYTPPSENLPRVINAGLGVNRSWEDTADEIKKLGIKPDAFEQQYRMQLARQKEAGEDIGTAEQFRRNYMPLGSIVNTVRDKQYTNALDRMKAGTATDDDYQRVAHQEALGQFDERVRNGPWYGQLADIGGKVAGMGGEALLAGGIMSKLGVPEAAASTWGAAAGRRALQTAAMPSMYLDQMTAINMREGRSATDPRGLLPAAALGYANTLVLGQLQAKTGNIIGKGLIGTAESQGVQVGAGLVDQYLLPKAYRMGTNYGAIGDWIDGNAGAGFKKLGVDLVTFSAFAGLHRLGEDGSVTAAAKAAAGDLLSTGKDAFESLVKAGYSPDAAAGRLSDTLDVFKKAVADSEANGRTMTREDGEKVFGTLLEAKGDNKLRDYAKQLTEGLPTAAEAKKTNPALEAAKPPEPAATPPFTSPEAPKPGAEMPHPLGKAPESPPETPAVAEQGRINARIKALVAAGHSPASAWNQASAEYHARNPVNKGTPLDLFGLSNRPETPPEAPAAPVPPEPAKPEITPPASNAEVPSGRSRRAAMMDRLKAAGAAPPPVEGHPGVLTDVIRDAGLEGKQSKAKAASEITRFLDYPSRSGGHPLTMSMEHDVARNSLRLNFTFDNRLGGLTDKAQPKMPQDAAVSMIRDLRKIAQTASKKGLNIEFAAEPNRAALYARGLERSGYEVASATPRPAEEGHNPETLLTDFVYRPKAADGAEIPHRASTNVGAKPAEAPPTVQPKNLLGSAPERPGFNPLETLLSISGDAKQSFDNLKPEQQGLLDEAKADGVVWRTEGEDGVVSYSPRPGLRVWMQNRPLIEAWKAEARAKMEKETPDSRSVEAQLDDAVRSASHWLHHGTPEHAQELIDRRYKELPAAKELAQRLFDLYTGKSEPPSALATEKPAEAPIPPAKGGSISVDKTVTWLKSEVDRYQRERLHEVPHEQIEKEADSVLHDLRKAHSDDELKTIAREVTGRGGRNASQAMDNIREEFVRVARVLKQNEWEFSRGERHVFPGTGEPAKFPFGETPSLPTPEAHTEYADAINAIQSEYTAATKDTGGAVPFEAVAPEIIARGHQAALSLKSAAREEEGRGGAARPAEARAGERTDKRNPDELNKAWAQNYVDGIETEEEWLETPKKFRDDIKNQWGIEWKGPKAASRESRGRGESVPLDPERERLIDEADPKRYPPNIKVGIKALMSGWSVTQAERAAGGVSKETIRTRARELFGETAWETIEADAKQNALKRVDRQREQTNTTEGPHIEGVYFHTPIGKPPGKPPETAPSGAEVPHLDSDADVTPASIIATQNKIFGTKGYIEPTGPYGAAAAAFTEERTTVTGEQYRGDEKINLEEHAHHLAARYGLPIDPRKLPMGVADGFRQFWDSTKPLDPRAVMEGFGQWMVKRAAGELDGSKMSTAQKLASEFAENWVESKGLTPALDLIREMHMKLAGKNPAERFAAIISKTGNVAMPEKGTATERLKEWTDNTLNDQARKKLDDVYDLVQIEAAEAARRKAAGLAPLAPGTLPSEVERAIKYRSMAEAQEMQKNGVHYFDKVGKQVRIGKSYEQIGEEQNLTPAEMENGGLLNSYMAAKDFVWDADHDQQSRPDADVVRARASLEWFKAHPEIEKRMEAAAKDVQKFIFGASHTAMEKSGFEKEGTRDKFEKDRPFYYPHKLTMDPEGMPLSQGRSYAGEAPSPGFLKKRTMSGGEIIGLQDAINDRLSYTAYILSKQAKDKAFHEFYSDKERGLGDVMFFLRPVPNEMGKKMLEFIKSHGATDEQAMDYMEYMHEDGKGDFFTADSFPRDPRRPSYVMKIDGKTIRARVGNKAIYELLTGTQGDGETTMKVAAALSAVSQPVASLQRLGFTMLSPLYHLHNLMPWRDAATFLGRTVSEKGFLHDVGDVYKWYRHSFAYYGAKLFGFKPGNVYFQLYDTMMGRRLTAEANRGLGSAKVVDGGWRGLYQRITDVMGFGEKALHVAEMKNVWDKAGWTEDKIKAELARDPSGASPIPFALQVAAFNAAGAVTHNYTTMGYQVRELNKSWPFLGVHIASAYKDISTFRVNPTLALRGLGVIVAAKMINWLINKDDPDYQQLSPQRRDGFILPTPVGQVYFPGPRGIQTPIVALIDESLRAANDNNPQFGTLLGRTLEHIAPSGGPAGITTAAEILANKTRGGFPIVPRGKENLSGTDKNLQYRLPYAASQLTGGIVPAQQLAEGGYNPVKSLMLPPQHEAVGRLRDMVHDMEADKAALPKGARYADENKLHRLNQAIARINELSANARKAGANADPAVVNRQQVSIAKAVLGQ